MTDEAIQYLLGQVESVVVLGGGLLSDDRSKVMGGLRRLAEERTELMVALDNILGEVSVKPQLRAMQFVEEAREAIDKARK